MHIRFLGTGAGDFLLTDDEACSSENVLRIRKLGGRNLRYASQALIEPDILLDFYSDRQLRQLNIAACDIRHLLITHCHWDHFHPRHILEFARGLAMPLEVYGNETAEAGIEFAASYEWDGKGRFCENTEEANVRFHRLIPGQTVTIGDAKVTALLANHHIHFENRTIEERALNYVIERDGRTLFYGLDTSYVLPGTLNRLQSFSLDLAVLDATFGYLRIDPATSGHLNFPMVQETLEEFRVKNIIDDRTAVFGSHISLDRVPAHDDIVAEVEKMGFTLAWDGLRAEV